MCRQSETSLANNEFISRSWLQGTVVTYRGISTKKMKFKFFFVQIIESEPIMGTSSELNSVLDQCNL
jgi:hypothetical protein